MSSVELPWGRETLRVLLPARWTLKGVLRRNHLGLYSPTLPEDTGRRLGMVRTFRELDALLRWGERCAPAKATVWVVPMGGSSYVPPPGD